MKFIPFNGFHFIENCNPQNASLLPGKYFFEAWGASGGGDNGGHGAYTAGIIKLTKETTFEIRIGGKGGDPIFDTESPVLGGCNGGGNGGLNSIETNLSYWSGGGGGGATDVRIIKSDLTDKRILVSGGGGGSTTNEETYTKGGHGGGFIGGDGEILNAKGGTQTGPGEANSEYRTCPDEGTCAGKFGYGGESICWEWTRGAVEVVGMVGPPGTLQKLDLEPVGLVMC